MSPSTPLVLALTGMILAGFTRGWVQRILSIAVSGSQLLIAIGLVIGASDGTIRVLQAGAWPAPFGISIVMDLTSGLFLLVSAFLLFGIHLSAMTSLTAEMERVFHPLWHALSLGVFGSFLTGDLFNLFVWFEVMLMASFALSSLGRLRSQWVATVYSLSLNLVGSSCFLLGLGFLYNATGTLNHADLVLLSGGSETLGISAVLLLIAFCLKSASFPLYHWLPASYPGIPIAQLALFAGLLTKVGVYTLVRFFGVQSALGDLSNSILSVTWTGVLWALALPTMLLGVLGAASQNSMRRILSFHIISQIGYMILAIGIGGTFGLAAAIFYVLHHMVVKANLFLVTGAIEGAYGTSDLSQVGNAKKWFPWLSALFLISALSLVGVPPLSGFWAKILVLGAAVRSRDSWGLSIGLVTGLLTLFSMIKIWSEVFLKSVPVAAHGKPLPRPVAIPWTRIFPIALFAAWTVWMGLFPGVFSDLSQKAADQLLSPERYRQVLSKGEEISQ